MAEGGASSQKYGNDSNHRENTFRRLADAEPYGRPVILPLYSNVYLGWNRNLRDNHLVL